MPTTRRHFQAAVIAAALFSALLAAPASARADWLVGGYVGGTWTANNTLDVTPATGATVSVPNVDYDGNPWTSPIYYGYRAGWTPHGGHVGFEFEFTHAKAIGTSLNRQTSPDLTAFELSHGLNFILGNVVYRTSPRCGGRCVFVTRGGAGITYPHVEATFRGRETQEYEYAGFGAQGGVGLEYKVWDYFSLVADGRLTYAHVSVDLVDGSQLAGPFTTFHADFGIAFHSAR